MPARPPAFLGDRLEVGFDHFLDQLLERGAMPPAELGPRLRGVAEQRIDLGRTEIARIDLDQHLAGRSVDSLLVDALAAPRDRLAGERERALDELAHRMLLTGGQHVVVGLALLEDRPRPLDIVARVAPVAPRIEIAEKEAVLHAVMDGGDRARNLARHEGLAADRAFVI